MAGAAPKLLRPEVVLPGSGKWQVEVTRRRESGNDVRVRLPDPRHRPLRWLLSRLVPLAVVLLGLAVLAGVQMALDDPWFLYWHGPDWLAIRWTGVFVWSLAAGTGVLLAALVARRRAREAFWLASSDPATRPGSTSLEGIAEVQAARLATPGLSTLRRHGFTILVLVLVTLAVAAVAMVASHVEGDPVDADGAEATCHGRCRQSMPTSGGLSDELEAAEPSPHECGAVSPKAISYCYEQARRTNGWPSPPPYLSLGCDQRRAHAYLDGTEDHLLSACLQRHGGE